MRHYTPVILPDGLERTTLGLDFMATHQHFPHKVLQGKYAIPADSVDDVGVDTSPWAWTPSRFASADSASRDVTDVQHGMAAASGYA